MSKAIRKAKVFCAVGGFSVGADIKQINQGIHLLVGTPGELWISCDICLRDEWIGRVNDMLNRGIIKYAFIHLLKFNILNFHNRPETIKTFVLDEFDILLSKTQRDEGTKKNTCIVYWMFNWSAWHTAETSRKYSDHSLRNNNQLGHFWSFQNTSQEQMDLLNGRTTKAAVARKC